MFCNTDTSQSSRNGVVGCDVVDHNAALRRQYLEQTFRRDSDNIRPSLCSAAFHCGLESCISVSNFQNLGGCHDSSVLY